MATDIKLPELGEGVTEGELVKWLVKPGDAVKADQTVAEIMTDKATVEVPSPVSGTVKELLFKPGQVIKVESTILTLSESAATTANTTKAVAQPVVAASQTLTTNSNSTENSNSTISVKLPELGEGVTEGELVKWTVNIGDVVKADQTVAEIMTDKATVEVPSPVSGTVKELKFKKGEVIKVESVILILSGASSTQTKPSSTAASINATASVSVSTSGPTNNSTLSMNTQPSSNVIYPPVADSKILATPATRRLAREMGVDINGLSGSGLAGRVTREDVISTKGGSTTLTSNGVGATSAGTATMQFPNNNPTSNPNNIPKPAFNSNNAALEERVDLLGIRKKIAQNMQMSKAIIPHFTIMDEANVTQLVALRESLKDFAEKNGTKITYLPFVVKAVIATIKEFPQFNASIDDANSQIVYKKYFNIGFAADTPNGLMVPVIKNADQKSILELSKEIIDLSTRARAGKLKPDEMKGATITITNIGSVGGTYATPIINHPEVAIIGMYKMSDKPILKEGQLAFIKSMNYTVTADHRLIDGAVAANFLKSFFNKIQNPGVLMMGMS